MSEEEVQYYIERARFQLPLPCEHKHDVIWLPVLSKDQGRRGGARASLLEAPEPIWGKPFHRVYFKKESLVGVVVGWEFLQIIEFQP